ncbi:MAG: amidohydrolase [Proteobacteria bacterium]|nr:amidohydrolase [Pseudomonadota bacterium]MBU1737500.1 amidohydrolase [Pseudomonadota bacterium]
MDLDLIISNCRTLPQNNTSPADNSLCYVALKQDRIFSNGPMAELDSRWQAKRVIDAGGALVMPGLINAHNHCAMTLFRGLADDLPLTDWLQNHIFPAEARFVSPEMVYWCSRLAAAEMIMSGTTTVADGYFFESDAARAFSDAGLRSVAAQGVIDFPSPDAPNPLENITVAADYIRSWQGHDLITPAIFCHSPYTCSATTIIKAKELARDTGCRLFIHVSETEAEVIQSRKQHSASPVRFLADLDILDQDTVCVHCVWLNNNDIQLIAESGASIVTCPESNMKLGSGIAPVAKFIAAGIRVGLGTDGAASNNNLDLFAEIDSAAKLHKAVSHEPTVLPAARVIDMATRDGANLLGLNDTGILTAGMKGDLIIVDLDKPHLTPQYDLASLMVYAASGSDVVTSIINGRIVMEDRVFPDTDLHQIMNIVQEMATKVTTAI